MQILSAEAPDALGERGFRGSGAIRNKPWWDRTESVASHLLRPIRDQVDADNAAEMIDLLAGHALNAEQADYLELLGDLYGKWESTQFLESFRLAMPLGRQN